MLATLMGPPLAGDFESTKSSPHSTCVAPPTPLLLRTRTDQSFASGATPRTPMPLSIAAIVPATWVPCPLKSSGLEPLEQLTPPMMFEARSGLFRSMPVSITATFTPVPFTVLDTAWMRETPVGVVWEAT